MNKELFSNQKQSIKVLKIAFSLILLVEHYMWKPSVKHKQLRKLSYHLYNQENKSRSEG